MWWTEFWYHSPDLFGKSNARVPTVSLTGVFLTDDVPNFTEVDDLDFTGNLDYLTISPELGQVFFIGDGLANDTTPQTIVVPEGRHPPLPGRP